VLGTIGLGHERADVLAAQVVALPAEDLLDRLVALEHDAAGVDHDDRVDDGLQHVVELRLTALQAARGGVECGAEAFDHPLLAHVEQPDQARQEEEEHDPPEHELGRRPGILRDRPKAPKQRAADHEDQDEDPANEPLAALGDVRGLLHEGRWGRQTAAAGSRPSSEAEERPAGEEPGGDWRKEGFLARSQRTQAKAPEGITGQSFPDSLPSRYRGAPSPRDCIDGLLQSRHDQSPAVP
jgi:hypothetical protein